MEVYETTNGVCESVVTTRVAHLGNLLTDGNLDLPGQKIAFHEYSLDAIETTPLSCCLAAEDYSENVNACVEVTMNIDEYTFD